MGKISDALEKSKKESKPPPLPDRNIIEADEVGAEHKKEFYNDSVVQSLGNATLDKNLVTLLKPNSLPCGWLSWPG